MIESEFVEGINLINQNLFAVYHRSISGISMREGRFFFAWNGNQHLPAHYYSSQNPVYSKGANMFVYTSGTCLFFKTKLNISTDSGDWNQ